MTEIETALLDALESLENNRRATEQRMMKALTHLGERLAELEQENTSLAKHLASLAAELERQSEIQTAQAVLQNRQSEILNQLAKR